MFLFDRGWAGGVAQRRRIMARASSRKLSPIRQFGVHQWTSQATALSGQLEIFLPGTAFDPGRKLSTRREPHLIRSGVFRFCP